MRNVATPCTANFQLKALTPSQEVDELLELHELKGRVRQEHENLLARIEREKQDTLKTAFDEGYASGQQSGISAFLDTIEKFEAERQLSLQATVELVRDCLNRILDDLPPAETIEATVQAVIAANADEQNFTLVVHPSRRIEADSVVARRFGAGGQHAISVSEDASLQTGDYVICTPRSIIDISLRSQVDSLCAAIENELSNSKQSALS